MLTTFKAFLQDVDAEEMYVTGQAGTGKTTGLAKLVQHCADEDLAYTVVAFTHKACNILRSKLPQNSSVRTLHSYLKKRPSINTHADSAQHITQNVRTGGSEKISILFIDEYSMVGERDLMDLRDNQDEHEELKIVWLGDPNQLPPVGDMQAVQPHGDYAMTLTKIYRQAADNPLMVPLQQLVSFIEGATPTQLIENNGLRRGLDIVEEYKADSRDIEFDGVVLAYTNQRVEELNIAIEGKYLPGLGDLLYSPTTKEFYSFVRWEEPADISYIMRAFGEPLTLRTKYKTLEFLLKQEYQYAVVVNDEGDEQLFCCMFGHYQFKLMLDRLKASAASSNKAIGANAAQWARENKDSRKAKRRALAWRSFLSFNDNIICLDFAHAMTVHKSQGSTYKTVYLDTKDLGRCATTDYLTYLKLMYVAISRASDYVITN